MSWENLFMPYANNKGADQPLHPHSLISTFVVRCLDRIIPLVSISEISSLYLASVAAQAGLSLTCSKNPKDRFSCDEAQIMKRIIGVVLDKLGNCKNCLDNSDKIKVNGFSREHKNELFGHAKIIVWPDLEDISLHWSVRQKLLSEEKVK